jgi:Na+/melibiose symporter-like transporter
MFVYPSVALIIAILAIYKYPLHGEKLKQIKEKLGQLHDEKRATI